MSLQIKKPRFIEVFLCLKFDEILDLPMERNFVKVEWGRLSTLVGERHSRIPVRNIWNLGLRAVRVDSIFNLFRH